MGIQLDEGDVSPTRDSVATPSLSSIDSRIQRQRWLDALFKGVSTLSALFVLLIVVATGFVLLKGSWPAIQKFGFSFFTSADWDPVNDQFGALVPIFGTLVTSIIALIIAVPLSFGIALFLTELAPRALRTPLGIIIELLAAIPSIIYGMWGLFVFAPFFAKHIEPWINDNLGSLPGVGVLFSGPPLGIGVFTAGLILAIMILPFISSVMRDVFLTVPNMLKESAYGLGATTWEVVHGVTLPYSKAGVIGGIMLGLGRALGETMAVTFVIGNAHDLSASLLMPGNTISSAIANEFTEAVGELYTASLIELGLVLFFITSLVLALARLLLMRLKAKEGLSA